MPDNVELELGGWQPQRDCRQGGRLNGHAALLLQRVGCPAASDLRSSSERKGKTACSKASSQHEGGSGGKSASRSARCMATRVASRDRTRASRQREHMPRSTRSQSARQAPGGSAPAVGSAARSRACSCSSSPTACSHCPADGAACALRRSSAHSWAKGAEAPLAAACVEWASRDASASTPARGAASSPLGASVTATPAASLVSASHASAEARPEPPPACSRRTISEPMARAARGDSLGSEAAGGGAAASGSPADRAGVTAVAASA